MPKSKSNKKKPQPSDEETKVVMTETKEASEAIEATETNVDDNPPPQPQEEKNPESQPAETIAQVLDKVGLATSDLTVQEKLEALCMIFNSTLTENLKMKESLANVNGQLEKNDMTKEAMQKLCEALRTQVTLKDEENNLKLQEETQKRIDITKNFESTMNELTKLIEVHSKHNTSLREENKMMATKLEELLAEFESRENKIHMISEEFSLKSKLYEAQVAKAKVEKAEVSADFNKERLQMQKALLEAKKNIDLLLTREDNLKEQIELYANQCEAMSKGVTDKKVNVGTFKTQVDNLNGKLKKLESETSVWKEKFQESNEVVVKMNSAKADSDRDLEATKKKLAAMEKLNRALQEERSKLIAQAKDNGNQNGNSH